MYIFVTSEQANAMRKASKEERSTKLYVDSSYKETIEEQGIEYGDIIHFLYVKKPEKELTYFSEFTEGTPNECLETRKISARIIDFQSVPQFGILNLEIEKIRFHGEKQEEKKEEVLDLAKELESRGANMGTGGFAIIYNYNQREEYTIHFMPISYCGSIMGAMIIEEDAQGLCDLLNRKRVPYEEVHKAFLDLLIKKKQEGEE